MMFLDLNLKCLGFMNFATPEFVQFISRTFLGFLKETYIMEEAMFYYLFTLSTI